MKPTDTAADRKLHPILRTLLRPFVRALRTREVAVIRPMRVIAYSLTLAAGVIGWHAYAHTAAAEAVNAPAPARDEPAAAGHTETAVLAGGCFWGVQGVFEHVKGVTRVESGYTGGNRGTAHYEAVSDGDTGHAESVRITFDPTQVSYGQLLQVFFSVAHDPTQINAQGPDEGTQYRSAVFPANDQQRQIAASYIAQLNSSHVYSRPIATHIEPLGGFYVAESYHQDYLTLHPDDPYIAINDMPKITELHKRFPALYRADPVRLTATSN